MSIFCSFIRLTDERAGMFESFGNRIGGVDRGSKLASPIVCSPVVPKVSQAHGTRNRTSRSAGLPGKTKTLMSLRKVYGGTPVGNESRCDTCVYARIIQGYGHNERITICDRLFQPIQIPFKVLECTDYADKRLPCVEDMEEIAWQLRSKSAGHGAGFVTVGELAGPGKKRK